MRRFISRALVLALVVTAVAAIGAQTAMASTTITLASGQGTVNTPDPNTQMSVDNGTTWTQATIVAGHPAYSTIPGTRWVSLNANMCCRPNNTVLYAADFVLPAGWSAPNLSVSVHADNAAAISLNGNAIGSQTQAEIMSNFQDPAESFGTTNASYFQTGTNRLLFTVTNYGDPSGLDYSATITFETNQAPDCSTVTATPSSIWPPNHKMKTVTLSGATDPDGDTVTLTVTSVTQDEVVAGPGGDHAPDAELTAAGNVVKVRAERDGSGDGRVYRIGFVGSDGNGGACTGTVTVSVPHDNSGAAAVDSGASYNSLTV